MTNPVVDVLADPDAGSDVDRRPSCRCTRSRGRPRCTRGSCRRAVASCLERTKARGFADPLDDRLPRRRTISSTARARTATSTGPRPWPTRTTAANRLKFDEFLRMQLALVARKRALAAEATGIEHVSRRRARAHASTPRSRSRSPTTRPRRIARDHRRPGAPGADAPAPPGRGGLGQDGRRAHRAAHRGAGRLPGRVHGADRGAGRAARAHHALAARRADRAATTARCSASDRCGWRCSRTAPRRRSAGASPTACSRATSTSWSEPTR